MSHERETGKQDSPNAFEEAGNLEQLSLWKEVWLFIVDNKAWWMIPIVLVFAFLGFLVALGSTGAAPFIYTFF